ncbi:hypothetical protein GM708_18045 [Vibrio cholerae]|nr:hypothetical protein [Vibrio cholerae]
MHAWVEVAFDGVGWVAFNPTPPEDNEPVPPQQQPKSSPKPQVLQPPPPPQEPAELPPDSAPEPQDAEEREKDLLDELAPYLTIIAIALIPVSCCSCRWSSSRCSSAGAASAASTTACRQNGSVAAGANW